MRDGCWARRYKMPVGHLCDQGCSCDEPCNLTPVNENNGLCSKHEAEILPLHQGA